MVHIDLTDLPRLINRVYYPCMSNQDRYLLLYGGAGSGKSVFCTQKILYRMLTEPNHRFLVVRKVARTLRNSVFSLLRDTTSDWGLASLFKINKSDMEIVCANGNNIIFAGLDDVEKLKSIAGVTGIWVEEASELTPQDFQQLDLRLRGPTKNYKQILISFNPISEQNWLKGYFFDFKKQSSTIVHTTYKDNHFIDGEYSRVLEELKEQDYNYYRIYALGEWGSLGNLVYSNYVIEDISTNPTSYSHVFYGMDFGYNDPSVCVAIGVKDQEIYVFDELYVVRKTNTEWIEEIRHRVPFEADIIADSAEPDRIQEFFKAGFRKIRPANKKKNSVKAGVDFLRSCRIHIAPHCTETIKEIRAYKYKEDKDGNVLDEPMPFNDHCMDALRYGVQLIRKARPRVKVSIG